MLDFCAANYCHLCKILSENMELVANAVQLDSKFHIHKHDYCVDDLY